VASKSQTNTNSSTNSAATNKRKRSKKSPSPNPNPNPNTNTNTPSNRSSTQKKKANNSIDPINSSNDENITSTQPDETVSAVTNTQLPPPSSITPSNSIRRSSRRNKNSVQHVQDIISSPLALKSDQQLNNVINDHTMAQSSPIRATRLNSLPSPSPEHPTKSSPIKNKKVMFNNENLVTYSKLITLPTPNKSILKTTMDSKPPQMNPLVPNTATDSVISGVTSNGMLNPSSIDFWTPGNIPRLSNASSINEELSFFKNIIHGGIVVLDSPNCDKQFEIYATINLLLKELTDKKLLILLGYLPELIQLLRKDIISIENDILTTETSNPFLVRTDIQITKILTQLISNMKLINTFWKKSKANFEYFKWCITHSASVVLKPTVSKSLLTANLQLIKDHKLHPYLSLQSQEFILYALLNMKFFNSSSLLVERLYTLKSLVVNHTLMMEKNSKSWLPFLFNCLCDFNSPIYQKQQQIATQVLLECSKLYIASRNMNFEIKRICQSPIHKTLQIAPDSQISINSSPLDLSQTTLDYISVCIEEMLQDQCKPAMDLWMGLTILLYNESGSLIEFLENGSRWHGIVKTCLKLENQEHRSHGVRAFRGLVYVLAKNIRVWDSSKRSIKVLDVDEIRKRLQVIFEVFDLVSDDYQDMEGLINLCTQIFYALLNNPMNDTEIVGIIWPFIDSLLKQLKSRSTVVEKICVRIFSHIVHITGQVPDGFYLVKCISVEMFNLNEVRHLHPDALFKLHDIIFQSFLDIVWNSSEDLKVKVHVLSNILNGLKYSSNRDGDLFDSRMYKIIQKYQAFFPEYIKQVQNQPSDIQLEHITKFALYIKTNFGNKIFYKICDGRLIPDVENIFVTIVYESVKSLNVKPTDILKFLMNHVKVYQYIFFEGLVLKCNENTIYQYVANNLESKIFEKNLSFTDVQSIGNTIAHLPFKSKHLLKNYLSHVSKSFPSNSMKFLNLNRWSVDDLHALSIISGYPSLTKYLLEALDSVLKIMATPNAIQLFTKWCQTDEFWALSKFTEHIYYHVMDPNSQYKEDVHLESITFLENYLTMVKNRHFDHLDMFIHHGLVLCEALKKDVKCEKRMIRIENVLKNILTEEDLEKLPNVKGQLAKQKEAEIQAGATAERVIGEKSAENQNTSMEDGLEDTVVIGNSSSQSENSEVQRNSAVEVPIQPAEENEVNIHESTQVIEQVEKTSSTIQDDESSRQSAGLDETQVIDNNEDSNDLETKSDVQPSSSVELTADWNESNSSDHEFYDAQEAQTTMNSSPVKTKNEISPSDDAKKEEEHVSSRNNLDIIQTISKELVEPVNQVDETQEIPDSNEDLGRNHNNGKEQKESLNDNQPGQPSFNDQQKHSFNEEQEDGKENEIPSDSIVLYSSPLKNAQRKLIPLIRFKDASPLKPIPQPSTIPVSQPVPTPQFQETRFVFVQPQKHAQVNDDDREKDDYSSDDSSDGDLIEIDNDEFSQSIEKICSPKKRTESPIVEPSFQPNKKVHLDNNSSGLDILTPPDDLIASTSKPVELVSNVLDGFTDEAINNMKDQEVYEIENKLLAFMMRMRNRQRS